MKQLKADLFSRPQKFNHHNQVAGGQLFHCSSMDCATTHGVRPQGQIVHNFSLEVISSIQRFKFAPSSITEEYILGAYELGSSLWICRNQGWDIPGGKSMFTQCCSLLMTFYNVSFVVWDGWVPSRGRVVPMIKGDFLNPSPESVSQSLPSHWSAQSTQMSLQRLAIYLILGYNTMLKIKFKFQQVSFCFPSLTILLT